MATLFGSHSMYRNTQPIMINGVATIGTWTPPNWIITRPDTRYIHKYQVPSNYEGRPDLIANYVYNADNLDWVLIMFNNARNVFGWPKTGTVIEYPDESIVFPSL